MLPCVDTLTFAGGRTSGSLPAAGCLGEPLKYPTFGAPTMFGTSGYAPVRDATALGVIGSLAGVPVGILVHRAVVPAMVHGIDAILPASVVDVWAAGLIAVLASSGIVIAAIGAFALGTFGLGFTVGGLVFGRWRRPRTG